MELSSVNNSVNKTNMPLEWDEVLLGRLIAIKGGFAFSSKYFSDKSGEIILTPGNFLLDGGLYFNEKNTKRYTGKFNKNEILNYGDLLVVMTDLTPDCNLLGKPAFVNIRKKVLHNQRIGLINIKKKVDSHFLYWLMLSPQYLKQIKDKATGSTVRHTSNKSIYASRITLPPLPEQKAIAEVLSDTDNLIQSLEKQIAKKRMIKQGTMQKLLSPKEGWDQKLLGDVLKIRHGKSQIHVISEDGKYPILGTGGILGYANQYLYNQASVLIGRKGTIDRPLFMDTPFWTVDTLFYSEIHVSAYPKFLYYKFLLIDWYAYNEASGVPSLNAKTIESIEISIPEQQEQKRIADIISDMDNEINALEKKLLKYVSLKKGLMQNLLTGRIRLT